MFHVYVLKNSKGKLYKGFTSNLKKRLEKHFVKDGFDSYTQKNGPWELVYQEAFNSAQEARKREKFFKSGQGREFLKNKLCAYPPKADG